MPIISSLHTNCSQPEVDSIHKGDLRSTELTSDFVQIELKTKTYMNIEPGYFVKSVVRFNRNQFKLWLESMLYELEE